MDTHLKAATEAYSRKEYFNCIEEASKVLTDHQDFDEAFRLRGTACCELKDINGIGVCAEQMSQMMGVVAMHPENITARSLIEQIFKDQLVEPDAKLILSAISYTRLIPVMDNLVTYAKSKPHYRDSLQKGGKTVSHEEVSEFIENTIRHSPKTTVIGAGTLPTKVRDDSKSEYIHFILEELMSSNMGDKHNSDEMFICHTVFLHVIVQLCHIHDNPSADLLALHFVIQYWATRGEYQRSRDLAETGLLNIRLKQPKHIEYRNSLAWLCWSEAWHRAQQPLEASQSIIYAAIAAEGNIFSIEWALRIPWMASKIFRDLSLTPMARELLKKRREILNSYYDKIPFNAELESDVAILQVDLFQAFGDEVKMRAVFSKSVELLKISNDKERASIVTAAINSFTELKKKGLTISTDDSELILRNLKSLPDAYGAQFKEIFTESIDYKKLQQHVLKIPEARYKEDAPDAIFSIIPVTFNALDVAYKTGDPDLFLLAATILSQPSLSSQQNGTSLQTQSGEKWLQDLKDPNHSTDKLSEIYVKGVVDAPSYSLHSLAEVDLLKLQSVLQLDESAEILALNEDLNLYQLSLYDGSDLKPILLNHDNWDPEAYKEWRKTYPRRYGEWEPQVNIQHPPKLSKEEVLSSLNKLTIQTREGHTRLILFPTAKLIGFPFNLLQNKTHETLIEKHPISIAPSASWLCQSRKTKWTGNRSKVAWLGSDDSQDLQLSILRSKLSAPIKENGITLIGKDNQHEIQANRLAIAASHGGLGSKGHFSTVTDYCISFNANEFGKTFRGCGCVVLLVCHGGSMEEKRNCAQSHGLVTELLANGVRTVVAAPWSITYDIAADWTAAFLTAITAKNSVADASWSANKVLEKKYNHPCASGALHVFGDGSFIPEKS